MFAIAAAGHNMFFALSTLSVARTAERAKSEHNEDERDPPNGPSKTTPRLFPKVPKDDAQEQRSGADVSELHLKAHAQEKSKLRR